MKRILLALGILCSSATLFAQVDMGIPNATGKGGTATAMLKDWEAIGINPSNLGWNDNYKFSITVLNIGLTAQSQAIDFPTLQHAMLHPRDTFSTADKQKYADLFTNPQGLNMTANVNWLATSIYFPKLGGIGFNVRDRSFAHVGLNQNAADVLFNGKNAAIYQDSSIYNKYMSTVFDGCNLTYLHYREMNISYGRRLFGFGDTDDKGNPAIQVFGGVGFKVLWGLANLNGKIQNNTLLGQSSFTTNYNINYGNIQNFTPQKTSSLFNSVGTGTGFDLGASVVIKSKFRFAVSATDFGSIRWSNNVLTARDTTVPPVDSTNTGLHNWELGSQASFLFGNTGFMNYRPGTPYKANLPTRLRFGYGMKIGERINLGLDVVLPMNKTLYNLSKPYFAVGGEVKIIEALKVNAGISGNSDLGWNVPFGITIGPLGPLEFGLASGDVLTFVSKSKNPNLSVAIAVIRINFGGPDSDKGGNNTPPTPGL